jgi:palmitoyl transferase
MRRLTTLLIATLLALGLSAPAQAAGCSDLWDWVDKACRRIADTYENGDRGVLVSGFAWHLPSTWTPERRAELNQNAWGGGLVRSVEESNGDTHDVFFLAFLDSHENIEFQVGYGWGTFWGPRDGLQVGVGYTAMIVQRPDILSGVPFPAILPLGYLRYQKATLITTFIPTLNNGINNGSVLYVFGKLTF